MIVGAFIVNKSQVISRFNDPLMVSKIEHLILDFMNNPQPLVIKGLYKYICNIKNDIFYVLITSLYFREVKGRKILSFISNNSTLDPIDQLITIDNVLYKGNPVYPNLGPIKHMDSQEEKIYKMMMKNKASELKKKYTKISKKQGSHLRSTPDLTNTFNQEEFHKKPIDLETKSSNLEKKKPRSFEVSKKDIFILLKEKLKCQVDVENTIKSVEINGEMILNIKKEEYKNIEISFNGDISKCKFSPKLDKESYKNNIIRSDKDFSINKNIALMKWKSQSLNYLPINFTFWPSEIKQGIFQVSLEFQVEEDVNNLIINIPNKFLLDVDSTGNYLEWKIGSVKKGDSDSLDFQCKCSDVSEIFPIELYFSMDKLDFTIKDICLVSEETENLEIKEVMEVEEYKVDYE